MIKSLDILYQDEYIVAISKPSGLLVHRTELDPFEQQFAVQILRNQLDRYVYPIHRIDKPTSGVLLFSLNLEIAQLLSQSLQDKQIYKSYIAIVRGWMPDEISIDRGIRQGRTNERKEALTHFQCLQTAEMPVPIGPYQSARYSLVMASPVTGRRHQIRKHLNHVSHPIIGDTWYGDRDHNRYFSEKKNISQMLLHSYQLQFSHPETKKQIKIKAPLPAHWQEALSLIGFDYKD